MIYDYKNAVDACKYIGTPGIFIFGSDMNSISNYICAVLHFIICKDGYVGFYHKSVLDINKQDFYYDCATKFIPLEDISLNVTQTGIQARNGDGGISVDPMELPMRARF